MPPVPFTKRIHEALDFAAIHHTGQSRKDPDVAIPYLSHLFGVAYIVAQHGCDEDVVVAAILHDFIEDVVEKLNKPELREEMRQRFGENVHMLVDFVTQVKRRPDGSKIPWAERGEAYRRRISDPSTPAGAKAISCADKIHNIESLLMALDRHHGREHEMWGRLKASPEEQLRKFQELHACLKERWDHPILYELGEQIRKLMTRLPAK